MAFFNVGILEFAFFLRKLETSKSKVFKEQNTGMMRVLTLFVLFYLPISLCAQKIQLIEGNLTKLKGTESIDVQITFDSLLVGAEIPEQTFIAEKKKLWEEKEAGKGSEWERHWHDSKSKLYRPTFNSIFAKNAGLKISSDAQYIIVIKTRQIEPVVESWGAVLSFQRKHG